MKDHGAPAPEAPPAGRPRRETAAVGGHRQGRQDEYGTLAHAQAIAARAAGPVDQLLRDECGHTPHHQQRQATLTAMAGFVRRLL